MLTSLTARILLAIVLLHEISYQIIIPIIEPLISHLQTQHFMSNGLLQGINIALFTVGVAIGAPLLGFCADRKPGKTILIICLTLLGCSSLLLSAALAFKNLLLFSLGRLLGGLAGAEIAIIQGIFATASHGRQRAIYFSQIGFMLTLGTIIGPIAGGYLADMPNHVIPSLQWPFIGVAALSVVALLLVRPLTISTTHSASDQPQPSSHSAFWWLIGSFFLLESVWSFYFQIIPTLLKSDFHLSNHLTGSLMSIMGITMCLALLAYRHLAFFSPKNIVRGGLAMCISGGLILLITHHLSALVASMVLMAIGVALSYTAIMAAYANSVKLSYQGVAMGFSLSVMAIAWTITGSVARTLYALSPALCSALIIVGFVITLGVFQKPFRS